MNVVATRGLGMVVCVFAIACGKPPVYIGTRAPNPNGCYVMFFEQPEFKSVADILNRPGRWPTLDGLHETTHDRWGNRIRSLRAGEIATIIAFTEPQFRGLSARYAPGTNHANLTPDVSGRISIP